MIVNLLEVCTLSKPSPWGEGGFKIFCKEILKTDVGKRSRIAEDPHKMQHISAPHISQKSNRFLTASPQGEAFRRSRASGINDHLQQKKPDPDGSGFDI